MGRLPSGEYVLVVVYYYSRFFEVDILRSVTSIKVIESLEKIFCTLGLPRSLKTDNGTQFVSHEFECFLKTNDIDRASHFDPALASGKWRGRKTDSEACLKPLGLLKLDRTMSGPRWESS